MVSLSFRMIPRSHRPKSQPACCRKGVHLLHIPARSPDLNPAEKYWTWMWRKLRAMDLEDLVAGRPPATRAQLRARVRQLVRTEKSKEVARNSVRGLKKVCKEVIKKKGHATRG